MVLVGLCLAMPVRAEETLLTSRGVTYRVITAVKGYYLVVPGRDTMPQPDPEESIARCDDLVAAIVALATAGGPRPEFARGPIVPQGRGTSFVDYPQRHQGYQVLGAGARVNLDQGGRIESMGFQYEDEAFPIFKPKDTTALRRTARRAVPRRITGPPIEERLVINTTGEAPARLTYYAIYPVRDWGRDSGWQVTVDAVTGKVLHSRSTIWHVTAAQP